MFRHLKTHQILSLMMLMFIAQACTCYGIPLDEYFPIMASPNQPPPEAAPVAVVSPPGMNCDHLRLTSPLDGLPNGTAIFYWDTLAGAASYRINIFSEGAFLAGFDAAADQTNLAADVSWNAIGGQFILTVELVAVGADGRTCSQIYTIPREAPRDTGSPEHPNQVPQPMPTATPTCEENPYGDYC